MKISVLGAGAIGSLLGGLLKRNRPDFDVVLVGRGSHTHAMLASGSVTVEGHWGRSDVSITPTLDVSAIADSDFVLVTVKSHETAAALAGAAPFFGDATVVSIQNGINEHLFAPFVSPERIVMGMTAINVVVTSPGQVRLHLDGATLVGPDSQNANANAARRAAALLRRSGMRIVETHDVLGARYNKLAINAFGYASCLSGTDFIEGGICSRVWRQSVGGPILAEGLRVFQLAGVQLAGIPGRPGAQAFSRIMQLLDQPVVGGLLSGALRRMYRGRPVRFSLGEDLKCGKLTEVDHINGRIVQLAEQCGSQAPFNALVSQLVHELERRNGASPLPDPASPAGLLGIEYVVSAFSSLARQPERFR